MSVKRSSDIFPWQKTLPSLSTIHNSRTKQLDLPTHDKNPISRGGCIFYFPFQHACIYHISISPALLGLFFNGDPLLLHSMDPAPIQLLTIYCELNRCIFITESCNWNHDHLQKKWIIWNTEKLPLKSSTKGANHSFDRGHKRIINS